MIQFEKVYSVYTYEVVSLHLHTAITLHCLDGNENLLKMFGNPSNSSAFYGPKLNL